MSPLFAEPHSREERSTATEREPVFTATTYALSHVALLAHRRNVASQEYAVHVSSVDTARTRNGVAQIAVVDPDSRSLDVRGRPTVHGSDRIALVRGNADGFSTPDSLSPNEVRTVRSDMTSADYNGDGYDDFVAAIPEQGRVLVYLGSRSGLSLSPSSVSTGTSPFGTAIF